MESNADEEALTLIKVLVSDFNFGSIVVQENGNPSIIDLIRSGKFAAKAGFSSKQAQSITDRTCSYLSKSLDPLLGADQPPGGGGGSPSGGGTDSTGLLPPPKVLHAVSSLASQTAVQNSFTGQDNGLSRTIACIVSLAEGCVSRAETAPDEALIEYSLLAANALLHGLSPLLVQSVVLDNLALQDLLGRLHILLVDTAKLAHLDVITLQPEGALQPATVDSTFWDWMFPSESRTEFIEELPGPALRLLDKLLTIGVSLLKNHWNVDPEAVKGMIVPLMVTEKGKDVLVLLFGRFLAAVDGNDGLAKLTLPLLVDTVSTLQSKDLATVHLHTIVVQALGSLCIACARGNNTWGYECAVDLLVKRYKQPLLQHREKRDGSITDVAIALHRVVRGVGGGSPSYRKDICLRLLQLFSECALVPQGQSPSTRLAMLLPSIADAVENYPQSRSFTRSIPLSDLSLDALNAMQTEEITFTRLFRQLWLYSSIYNLGNMGAQASMHGGNLKEQHLALARIAATSPPLLVGSEEQKVEVMTGQLEVEFASRLSKLEEMGSTAFLTRRIELLVGPCGQISGQLSACQAAHVLTIAYKGISHATHHQWQIKETNDGPLKLILVHLQVSHHDVPWLPWLHQILRKVFSLYIAQLQAMSQSQSREKRVVAADASEEMCLVLIAALVPRHEADDVPTIASTLLNQLMMQWPGLQFKTRTFSALLDSLAAEQAYNYSAGAKPHHIVRSWLTRLSQRAMQTAPGPTMALIQEFVRALISDSSQKSVAASKFTPDLLQAVQKQSQASAQDYEQTRIDVWSLMLRSLGVVQGLADVATSSGFPPSSVIIRCTQLLMQQLQQGDQEAVITRTLEAAASVILYRDSTMWEHTLKLIARVPAIYFEPDVVHAAVTVWHWLVMTNTQELTVVLISEVVNSWLWTQEQRIGLFADATDMVSPEAMCGADKDVVFSGIQTHHTWIVFFSEVWQVLKHEVPALKPGTVQSLWKMLGCSIHDPKMPLTTFPGSCAARFRLLDLAVDFCCELVGTGVVEHQHGAILYTDTLAAAFDWFTAPVAWFHASKAVCREATSAVTAFLNTLSATQTVAQSMASSSGTNDLDNRLALLRFLLDSEIARLSVWSDPLEVRSQVNGLNLSDKQWNQYIKTAWSISPALALSLQARFPAVRALEQNLKILVSAHAADPDLHAMPEAVEFLVTPEAVAADAPELKYLEEWADTPAVQAMHMLSSPVRKHPAVMNYLSRSLLSCNPDEVAFFLPQLVQLLRFQEEGIERFLCNAASHSVHFAYLLVCQLSSEGTPPEEAFNPAVKRSNWSPPVDTGLWAIADRVKGLVLDSLPETTKAHLVAEMKFFDEVTAVSGKLYPVPKEERKAAAVDFLSSIKIPRDDIFLPTNPHTILTAVVCEGAAPMQSAAKCPILVPFKVTQEGGGGEQRQEVQACIFKVGDDCRQDMLALQVVSLLRDAFCSAGLDLHLKPYHVVPTAHEEGVIEVVPHAKSRAQLGELTDGGLFEIFQLEFGMPGSKRFERARKNFVTSSAGYAVASYILQAKDRHNGNIMIDNVGNIIHIDFGYILGISPGGNMGFESAAFKLSYEMTELLDPGNTRTSSTFLEFQELCVRGYLAARSVATGIITTVALMEQSQLPCFGRGAPLSTLKERFHLEMTTPQAAAFMRQLINDAYDKWTTGVYDLIQYYQNQIPF